MTSHDALALAVRAVRDRSPLRPRLALVLGSGLNALAETAADGVAIETADVPGYPRSSVEGHRGRLVVGWLEGCPCLFVQGRLHAYEGYGPDGITLPIRVAHALGARRVLLTNAAGGITLGPGTLMWITDHIDWVHRARFDPESGDVPGAWARPRGSPWDAAWTRRVAADALAAGIPTVTGTYLWTLGPSFETRAEIRAFARLGVDAVGMSTVPEAVAAHGLGMRVVGLSTITNAATGLSAGPLDHEEVLQAGRLANDALARMVRVVARSVGRPRAKR